MSGLLVAVTGALMLLSAGVELAGGGPSAAGLAAPGVVAVAGGLAAWRFTEAPRRLPIGAVFASVGWAWLAMSASAAVPYLTTGVLERFDNALFEAVSGVTTTGATVLPSVEAQSAGVLFWRATTQWMGGLGVVVLAVAVLPYLGVGGLSLLRSEAPGHSSEHLAPRVRDTVRRLSVLYAAMTVVVTAAYLVGGMSPFDAATHAFTTVSTGGFSTRDGNFGAFDSATLEWIAVVMMFFAGSSFLLLYRAARGRFGPFLASTEARAYALLLVGVSALAVLWNGIDAGFGHETVRESVFTVVAIGSTTGFAVADFGEWNQAGQAVLVFLMLVGGMSGSTAGGSKVFRLLSAASYVWRELRRHIHPRLVGTVRLGREVVPEEVVSRIVGYHALLFGVVVAGSVAVAAFGVDILTSLSAVASATGNVGPALGDVSATGNFLLVEPGARAVVIVLMLLGRLEIYPLLLGTLEAFDRMRSALPARLARAITRQLP